MKRPYLTRDEQLMTGQKLRTERLRRGLTQSDMGEMMGLSTSYISSLERGQRRISWNVGKKLHQCFGISYDYIMEAGAQPSPYGDLLREPSDQELHHRFQVMLGTCTDLELRACYNMCRTYIASSRKPSVPISAIQQELPVSTAGSQNSLPSDLSSP